MRIFYYYKFSVFCGLYIYTHIERMTAGHTSQPLSFHRLFHSLTFFN